jgi:hypothetical protein
MDGCDYGSRSWIRSDERTVVGDNDMERQHLLKAGRKYIPSRSTCGKFFGRAILLALILWCGALIESTYNEDKYARLERRWRVEERKHTQQRGVWEADRSKYEIDSERWAREQEAHQADMEKWDREKEEEKRKRDAISWSNLTPANQCLRYDTREYTATLSNVPLSYDARDECAQKVAYLNGKWVTPSYCGAQGQCSSVVGHWIMNENEPACQTVWAGPWDKGCQSPGVRHYHTILDNMLSWDNWHEMCMTTPGISINGEFHPSPTKCETWQGKVWGVWFINDSRCP